SHRITAARLASPPCRAPTLRFCCSRGLYTPAMDDVDRGTVRRRTKRHQCYSTAMYSLLITLGVLICVLMATWLGMWARPRLPDHHLDAESKDAVKLGMGLIATMSALVLGLLVASAKSSYDTQRTEIRQAAANVANLDRL